MIEENFAISTQPHWPFSSLSASLNLRLWLANSMIFSCFFLPNNYVKLDHETLKRKCSFILGPSCEMEVKRLTKSKFSSPGVNSVADDRFVFDC